jgi:enterochelin esterase-like enzyme
MLALAILLTHPAAGADPALAQAVPMCDESTGQIVDDSVSSSVYQTSVPIAVYVPPCFDVDLPRLPVIYLLHGGGGNQTEWPSLDLASAADALIASGTPPFLVVMPGGDYVTGLSYEDFVLRDLLPDIACRYRARTDSGGRTIGGLSLGGYWALRTALDHPRLFAVVGGHSPVVDRGSTDDPLALASRASAQDQLTVILDAGSDDSLAFGTQLMARILQQHGVSATFTTSPGGHESSYWRAHTAEYVRGYVDAFGQSARTGLPQVAWSAWGGGQAPWQPDQCAIQP